MVLPPSIVKLFSRQARIFFFEPYFFVKRHVKRSQLQLVNVAQLLNKRDYVRKQGIRLKRMKSSTPWDATWNSRRGTQWPRRGIKKRTPPPKRPRERTDRGCFLPTDKKAFFMARYVQFFLFYYKYSLSYCLPSIAVVFLHP